MKTDISIHDFLALGPEAFRVLAGGKELQGEYRFRSETFKNIERRADGVYVPTDPNQPLWVVEFQAAPKPTDL